jgi:hypothetical protein
MNRMLTSIVALILAGCGAMPVPADGGQDRADSVSAADATAPVDVAADLAPTLDAMPLDESAPADVPTADAAPDATRACIPGATQVCACTNGRAGAQSCLDTGAGFGPCACSSCAGRVCGPDGAGGSCGTCPAGNVCSAAGACSPMAVACAPCTTDAQCPGSTCVARSCDGTRGCAPAGATECARIGTLDCPYTSAYHQCLGSTACGPGAACISPYPGAPASETHRVCSRSGCATAADCPPSMATGFPGSGMPYCGPDHQCYLGCNAFGACTFDGVVRCNRNAAGSYAVCY